MPPRKKMPTTPDDLSDMLPDDDIPVVASRRGSAKKAVAKSAAKDARPAAHPRAPHLDMHKDGRSVPVLHTMPSSSRGGWHGSVEEHHFEWFGRLAAVLVVSCGALIFLMSPVLHRPFLKFLQPWGGQVATAPQPAAPTTMPVSAVVLVATKPDASRASALVGRVVQAEAEATGKFPATGKEETSDARAGGTVKIVNTADRGFTFVARTRLLSKDGVLFRMTAPASIPAKKTITVEVLADQPGPSGDIGPTEFTIPGLATAEQREQVYGVSESPMTGGAGLRSVVSEDDRTAARTALTSQLSTAVQDDLRALVKPEERLLSGLVTSGETEFEAPKALTAASSFTATLSGTSSVLLFDEQQAVTVLRDKVAALRNLPSSDAVELSGVRFVVQAYDAKAGVAEIRVEAEIPVQ
jgi:hypothetical protein